ARPVPGARWDAGTRKASRPVTDPQPERGDAQVRRTGAGPWLPGDVHASTAARRARQPAGRAATTCLGLATQPERRDKLLVARVLGARQVRQEAAAAANHLEQAAA